MILSVQFPPSLYANLVFLQKMYADNQGLSICLYTDKCANGNDSVTILFTLFPLVCSYFHHKTKLMNIHSPGFPLNILDTELLRHYGILG